MKAYILCIGDELLIGQVVNTNAAFIAQRLGNVGVEIVRIAVAGDDENDILDLLDESMQMADCVLVTGGLGPTHDDITKHVLAKFFHTDLVWNNDVLTHIQTIAAQRKITLTESGKEQAIVPRSAAIVHNRHGTAPGLYFEQDSKWLLAMPGVPYEMEAMIDAFVLPKIETHRLSPFTMHRTLNTTGIPESHLSDKLGNLDQLLDGAKLAFLPSTMGVRLRVSVIEKDKAAAAKKITEIEKRIREKAEQYIFSTDDEPLEEAVGKLLADRQLTIAVAESCTGGLIAHKLTNISGSSRYVERCFVTYSNRSKTEELNVPEELIQRHGAVSREVAEAMAQGARLAAKANIGISTTGIAGPTGGTPEKPVGLVWIGYSDEEETLAVSIHSGGNRLQIKERATQSALNIVRKKVLKIS